MWQGYAEIQQGTEIEGSENFGLPSGSLARLRLDYFMVGYQGPSFQHHGHVDRHYQSLGGEGIHTSKFVFHSLSSAWGLACSRARFTNFPFIILQLPD